MQNAADPLRDFKDCEYDFHFFLFIYFLFFDFVRVTYRTEERENFW